MRSLADDIARRLAIDRIVPRHGEQVQPPCAGFGTVLKSK